MRRIALVLTVISLAGPGHAGDGALEINQTCAVQSGCFPGDAAGYPVTIGSPGAYRLTSSLNQSFLIGVITPTHAIEIASDDVRIDLGGFGIRCSPVGGSTCGGTAHGITSDASGYEGIAIENGVITGMPDAGISLPDALGVHVADVAVRDNGGAGISLGDGSIVEDVIASGNGTDGIRMTTNGRVAASVARANGDGGIVVSAGSIVTGCTAMSNLGTGITATVGLVEGNHVYDNGGMGLGLTLSTGYRGNAVNGNAGGTVSTAVNLGGNACNGNAICP